jgi:hypothetical protein
MSNDQQAESDRLHREGFEATAYDPDPFACPECGVSASCCICGDRTCEVCKCQPCGCRDDDDQQEGDWY